MDLAVGRDTFLDSEIEALEQHLKRLRAVREVSSVHNGEGTEPSSHDFDNLVEDTIAFYATRQAQWTEMNMSKGADEGEGASERTTAGEDGRMEESHAEEVQASESANSEEEEQQGRRGRLEDLQARIRRIGGVPALGSNFVLPRATARQLSGLSATASPAAREILVARLGEGSASPALPNSQHWSGAGGPRPAVPTRSAQMGGLAAELNAALRRRQQENNEPM